MRRAETGALLLALAGFATLSIGDAVVKSMAGQWSPFAIAGLRYVMATSLLGALLVSRKESLLPERFRRWHMLRGLAVGIGAACFFLALNFMPLAEATAISFTSPMFAALLAWPLLGERMRMRTAVATTVAFSGAILILKPNLAVAGVVAVLPMVTALTTATMIIGNRKTAGSGSALAMQAYMVMFALPVLAAMVIAGDLSGMPALDVTVPDWTIVARCLVLTLTATLGHYLIFAATVRAGAALVAPMIYVQLIVAMAIGWAIFGEAPDATGLTGAAIIVLSGLFMLGSGRRREVAATPTRLA